MFHLIALKTDYAFCTLKTEKDENHSIERAQATDRYMSEKQDIKVIISVSKRI